MTGFVTVVVIIVLLIAMIASLGVGLYHLLKTPDERDNGGKNDGKNGGKVVMALTWRIGIWVVLFGFIYLSIQMGWIKPSNSINPIRFNQEQQQRIDKGE